MTVSAAVWRQARDLVAARLGLHLPESRLPDLERGLDDLLRHAAIHPPERFLAWLAAQPDDRPEWKRLVRHLTIGETYFFRDRACFDALEQQVLAPLIAARRAAGMRWLRLWSAGCASGEEPFSLAILIDRLLPDRADWAITILATDLNAEALKTAARGVYRRWSLRDLPPWVEAAYFREIGANRFEIDAPIRKMVTFTPLNLAAEGYPALMTNTTAIDVILCRNVLMYLTPQAQRPAAQRLARCLVPGGWLVVAPAETSVEMFRPLVHTAFSGAIFYRREAATNAMVSPPPAVAAAVPEPPRPRARRRVAKPRKDADASRAESDSAAAIIGRARILADSGDLEAAHLLCEAAVENDPTAFDVHFLMAAIHQEQGRQAAAVEALRRCIHLAPDFTPAHFLLAVLYRQAGDSTRGRQEMQIVMRLLRPVPRDKIVAGSDGLTAGRLMEMAEMAISANG